MLQQMISRSMNDVRSADKATRQLMHIEIAAKQLALQIAEYEDMVGSQEPPGAQGQGHQVMGDESGA